MKWEAKMDMVVKDIMGIQYTCVIDADNSFSIYENNEQVAQHTTLLQLKPHWKNQLRNVLMMMYKQKIQNALLKV